MLLSIVLFTCAVSAPHAQDTGDLTLGGVPLVEVPAQGEPHRLAVFYSGDGGWASLDRVVAARLADAGVTVVGVSSLRYFWRERLPDEAAADLARVLESRLHNLPAGTPVLLIGFSSGADVMPFLVNRLPDALRARIVSVNLISPGRSAQFAIHVANWVPVRAGAGMPVMPEVEKMGLPLLCLYGDGDEDALCPELSAEQGTSMQIGTGHHLGGAYEAMADRILEFADSVTRTRPGSRP